MSLALLPPTDYAGLQRERPNARPAVALEIPAVGRYGDLLEVIPRQNKARGFKAQGWASAPRRVGRHLAHITDVSIHSLPMLFLWA